MTMNIYVHEIKAKIKSVLIWSASIAALILVFMSLYKGFSTQTEVLAEATKNFPHQLLVAFGMENMDWASSLGFFALIFLFCQVCLAIQAANYGFGLVSIEETEWTADFLVAKPVSRPSIMTSKLLAALTGLTITNAVVWACSFFGLSVMAKGHEYEAKNLVILLLSVVVFQLFFLSVGMVISLMVKRIRSVTPFSMGLVFGLYILNVFGDMLGEKSLEVISPFKHFDANYIIKNAAWDTPLVMISVGVIVVALLASYVLYARRNIPSAV
jgi:beta-exotoxin I transport system permease protein